MTNLTSRTSAGTLEKVLLAIALVYGLVVTGWIWGLVALQQPVWPFPALYFLEIMLLSWLAMISVFRSWPFRMLIIAGPAGAVTSFSVMGAWSVGLFYIPLALLLVLGALSSWQANRQPITMFLGAYILFVAVQTFTMLILVSLA